MNIYTLRQQQPTNASHYKSKQAHMASEAYWVLTVCMWHLLLDRSARPLRQFWLLWKQDCGHTTDKTSRGILANFCFMSIRIFRLKTSLLCLSITFKWGHFFMVLLVLFSGSIWVQLSSSFVGDYKQQHFKQWSHSWCRLLLHCGLLYFYSTLQSCFFCVRCQQWTVQLYTSFVAELIEGAAWKESLFCDRWPVPVGHLCHHHLHRAKNWFLNSATPHPAPPPSSNRTTGCHRGGGMMLDGISVNRGGVCFLLWLLTDRVSLFGPVTCCSQ